MNESEPQLNNHHTTAAFGSNGTLMQHWNTAQHTRTYANTILVALKKTLEPSRVPEFCPVLIEALSGNIIVRR